MSITRINNNVAALNANRNLNVTGRSLSKSIERLSSGLRINRAGDDAAGLTVATRIRSQVRGLDRAIMNAQDGINLINVAEGALEEVTSRLDRIRVLAIQAANTGVNDLQARQALQDEVFQSIDEITRIAETTQYSTNFLLNGDFSVDSQIKPGQDGAHQFGIHIDNGPGSNTVESGRSYLNVIRTRTGYEYLIAGTDDNGETATMHLGTRNMTDIAVTLGRFSTTIGLNGTAGVAATMLGVNGSTNGFFNGVSIHNGDQIVFQGVLSDGVTKFSGVMSTGASFQIGVSTDTGATNRLLGIINNAIDRAEAALFGVSAASVPTAFRTTVTLASATSSNRGRLQLVSSLEAINLSSIDITLVRGNKVVTSSSGVTRSGPIGTASVLSGGGQVGNSVTAITGSTFVDGMFSISVEDVQGPVNRVVEGTIKFRNHSGATISRTASLVSANVGLNLNGSFVNGIYTSGVSISHGDTISLRGTEADGSTFLAVYSFSNAASTDTDLNDFQFASLSGLISELNYRTRDYTVNSEDGKKSRFETAIFTVTADGRLQLIDDVGRNDSKLNFTLVFNDSTSRATPSYTITDDAVLVKEGFAETATLRINGGPAIRAEAGELVTLYGPEATREGQVRGQVTLRVGSNLKIGVDYLKVEAQEFVGKLNGGPAVTFQNGAQNVVFIDNGSFKEGVARFLTFDFDTILDITAAPNGQADPGTTIIISTVNRSMNFHIGAFANQSFRISVGDLSAQNLGFGRGSGRTIENIDVRTLSGANEALKIVDAAMDQVNRTRSLLGAGTNRLEGTISNQSIASENLLASESRLRDADIALESSNFAKNQVLIQAGVSVLAQANFLPQSFLSLLG
jgi:flagellin